MASSKSRVAFAGTEDRKSGVSLSIKTLGINPVKNKDVLIKPNFNTADRTPGSTHNDTLVALVEEHVYRVRLVILAARFGPDHDPAVKFLENSLAECAGVIRTNAAGNKLAAEEPVELAGDSNDKGLGHALPR